MSRHWYARMAYDSRTSEDLCCKYYPDPFDTARNFIARLIREERHYWDLYGIDDYHMSKEDHVELIKNYDDAINTVKSFDGTSGKLEIKISAPSYVNVFRIELRNC